MHEASSLNEFENITWSLIRGLKGVGAQCSGSVTDRKPNTLPSGSVCSEQAASHGGGACQFGQRRHSSSATTENLCLPWQRKKRNFLFLFPEKIKPFPTAVALVLFQLINTMAHRAGSTGVGRPCVFTQHSLSCSVGYMPPAG